MNRTPDRLRITGREGAALTLAPFERLKLPASKLRPFELTALVDAGVIENVAGKQPSSSVRLVVSAQVGFFVVLAASMVVGSVLLSGLVLVMAAVMAAYLLPRYPARDFAGSLRTLLVRLGRYWVEMSLRMRDHCTLLLVVLIAGGLPGLAVVNAARQEMTSGDLPHLFVRYGFPWIFVAMLAFMPVGLYFLFDREQLGALSGRFVRHAFRLDPSIATMRDLEAKYGRQMIEVFGAWSQFRRTNRVPQGRRSPLWLTTLLVSIGWVTTLLIPHLRETATSAADAGLFNSPIPASSVTGFAFLGAYFFAIQAVLRGYVRRDLRPKTYTSISVRFLVVTILAWVITVSAPEDNEVLWVLAFLTGVVPETGLRYLREFLMSRNAVRDLVPSLYERAPLTDLEGIDVYDRRRLEDEGVTNVEALAHSDLVELMLHTRIPAARLVDWVDQATLYLHLGLYDEVDPDGPAHRLRRRLGHHGIRTATDLLHAHHAASKRAEDGPARLCRALTKGEADGAFRLQMIVDGLDDEEWLRNILYWRQCCERRERTREEHCPAPDPVPDPPEIASIPPAREVALMKPAPLAPSGAMAAATEAVEAAS